MNKNTFEIALLLVRLIVAVMVIYIFPTITKYIKTRQIYTVVDKAVKAAQQVWWQKSGADRKAYALSFVKDALSKLNITCDDEQISKLIEAAVMELHLEKGDLKES